MVINIILYYETAGFLTLSQNVDQLINLHKNMKIKIVSFGDHFNPLLGNGAIWTSMSNGNHKCRLCNKNFRRSIACNVKLSYNS